MERRKSTWHLKYSLRWESNHKRIQIVAPGAKHTVSFKFGQSQSEMRMSASCSQSEASFSQTHATRRERISEDLTQFWKRKFIIFIMFIMNSAKLKNKNLRNQN